jgi:hypothetical protein
MNPACEYIMGALPPGRRLLVVLSDSTALSPVSLANPSALICQGWYVLKMLILNTYVHTPHIHSVTHTHTHTHTHHTCSQWHKHAHINTKKGQADHAELLDSWNLFNLITISSVSILSAFLTHMLKCQGNDYSLSSCVSHNITYATSYHIPYLHANTTKQNL